jgi:16S rRNA (guanine527-N7)-methyltransferase
MNPAELLSKGLTVIGVQYDSKHIGLFLDYMTELRRWNRAYNLTGLRTDSEIIEKHFLDSLFYLNALPSGDCSIVDAGSGAGFPGLPIGIIRPECVVTLIEPSRKKASFLRNVIRKLSLENVDVKQCRLGKEAPSGKLYDVIVTRATFSIAGFAATACGMLKPGGRLVISKGPAYRKEIKEMEELQTVISSGCRVKDIIDCRLPFSGDERHLVVLTR